MNYKVKKAVISILGVATLAAVVSPAHAITVNPLGTLTSVGLTENVSLAPYSWDGNNNGSFGWMHTSSWSTFNISQASEVNITLTRSGSASNATSPAFTVWSYSGNPDWSSYDTSVNGAMDYDQLTGKTGSSNSNWLPLTGFARYANAGTSFTNDNGSALSHTSLGDSSVAALSFNFSAGNYLIVMGGSCSSATCASAGAQSASLSISPAAVPLPGTVWLFGSAVAGVIGASRRKST